MANALHMTGQYPHHRVREAWLALSKEEAISPDQPIFDAHHHLWDRPEGRYTCGEFQDDVGQGHDVRASLFVQCRTGYRSDGPEELRPLGEVETILEWCHAFPEHPAGLIVYADLQLGEKVDPVLDAMLLAGGAKVLGVRNTTAYHPSPAISSNPVPAQDGILRSEAFKTGAKRLIERGLTLDVWAYQTQLDDVCALARALPELSVVVNHCGGPLGMGPYRRDRREAFHAWRSSLKQVAELPNTRIKIGGFGLKVVGFDYASQPTPPDSHQLAKDWAPYFDSCLDLFGSNRAMFESNFPVDKGQFSYCTLWNAFKRLSENLQEDERCDLFWRSAAQCYGVSDRHFQTHQDRRH